MMERLIKAWLHRHGVHHFCIRRRVVDRYDLSKESIVMADGSEIDVTPWNGRPVYREAHGFYQRRAR